MKIISVTNRKLCKSNFSKQIEKICSANVNAVILREKDLSENEYKKLFINTNKICVKYGVPLFINSKIDTAIILNHKNIQLSFNDFLNNKDSLNLFENIGVSVHSVQEAVEVNNFYKLFSLSPLPPFTLFLVAGHIFETDCKKGLKPRGTEFIKGICKNTDIPVFAIGGISANNINLLKDTGIAGVCLMSSLMTSKEPEEIINKINLN